METARPVQLDTLLIQLLDMYLVVLQIVPAALMDYVMVAMLDMHHSLVLAYVVQETVLHVQLAHAPVAILPISL